jgi:hypothetical protein
VLEETPLPETEDRTAIFKWSVDVHNIVNERLGKPTVGYEEAFATWSGAQQPEPLNFDLKLILIAILVCIIIFLILNKNK